MILFKKMIDNMTKMVQSSMDARSGTAANLDKIVTNFRSCKSAAKTNSFIKAQSVTQRKLTFARLRYLNDNPAEITKGDEVQINLLVRLLEK